MTDEPSKAKLGIIAGGGALPSLLVSACEGSGRDYYVLALTGFAEESSFSHPPQAWIRLGEVGKGLEALRNAGAKDVVMAGSVKRPALSDLKPDLKGAAWLAKVAGRALGDDRLLSAVIGEIEREGFRVVGVDSLLKDLLAASGPLGRYLPDTAAERDIIRGFQVARALGAADVGQAVVVQQGLVLGLEAVEGTDVLLDRCAHLRREGLGGVLVKAKKPRQERRADLPTIGTATVKNAHAAGLRGIAVEFGHALIINKPAVSALADELGLFVVGHTGFTSEADFG